MSKVTAAHLQKQTDSIAFYYPAHEPRESDPHYKIFNATKRRLIKAGAACWICGTRKHLEIHHNEIEFAAAAGIDLKKFEHCFPRAGVKTEDDLLQWLEGQDNMRVLCAAHHRDPIRGIHHCAFPNWVLQRYWKSGIPAPVERPK